MLECVKTVSLPDWMRAAETRKVMSVFDGSQSPSALFVGGCVRNALLGESVSDIDIATIYTPEDVIQRLERAGIKSVPTGVEYGTVTAVVDKKSFEITTLREDLDTDGRRATVDFTSNWVKDAQRRDFTVNTLLADTDGRIYDPLGVGVPHLEDRKIIFVGDPDRRIAEDYLRILRFFRFHAYYGSGNPDQDALLACKKAAKQIDTLSRERITQEFLKILSAEDPARVLNLMYDHGVLTAITECDFSLLKRVCQIQNRYKVYALSTRLSIAIENSPDHERYICMPKTYKKEIQLLLSMQELTPFSDEHAVKVSIYKYGTQATQQALVMAYARDYISSGFMNRAIDMTRKWDIPVFPITGQMLIDQGIKPGPKLGKRLAELESEWIARGFEGA